MMEDRLAEITAEEWEHLRRAAELVDGKRAGFLVTDRPPDDPVFRLWGHYCDEERLPDVYARIDGEHAHVRLDMLPCGRRLTEPALEQAIVLLFGVEMLEVHRRWRDRGRRHGLSDGELRRYFVAVGNGWPVYLIGSERVSAGRAEVVAEGLVKVAREASEWVETVQ